MHAGACIATHARLAGAAPLLPTMAYRLSNPWTRVGVLVNFWRKASLRLCAGSVEMMRTFCRHPASCTARLLEQVVFPTPPLPPTKIHFSECSSSTFCSVGSGGASMAGRHNGAIKEVGACCAVYAELLWDALCAQVTAPLGFCSASTARAGRSEADSQLAIASIHAQPYNASSFDQGRFRSSIMPGSAQLSTL